MNKQGPPPGAVRRPWPRDYPVCLAGILVALLGLASCRAPLLDEQSATASDAMQDVGGSLDGQVLSDALGKDAAADTLAGDAGDAADTVDTLDATDATDAVGVDGGPDGADTASLDADTAGSDSADATDTPDAPETADAADTAEPGDAGPLCTTASCDDKNLCTDDFCDPAKGCAHVPKAGACDDGNACTDGDFCEVGVCKGSPKNCADNLPCTTDSCDKGTGCSHQGVDSACKDSDPCTVDQCDGKYGCVHFATETTLTCDDGDACTKGDTCQGGKCKGGAFVCACSSDADCANPNKCLGDYQCVAGSCKVKPGTAVVCTGTVAECHALQCDPATGQCGQVPSGDGLPCGNNQCVVGAVCGAGKCAGLPLNCDDANPCTADTCAVDLGCIYTATTSGCDDGNACTTGDACSDKGCQPGQPINCNDLNPCTSDSCKDGACTSTPNAAACDDNNPCTENDTCGGGSCKGTAVATCCKSDLGCDDKNPCTTDSCNVATGVCSSAPSSGGVCNDGNACTTQDTCASGTCQGSKLDCSGKADACHDAVCNTTTGCQAEVKLDGTPCDDKNACTVSDGCSSGNCTGSAKLCDDANTCTTDSCDPNSGCVNAANTASCDSDGSACTTDVCQNKVCTVAIALVCPKLACAANACDAKTGTCIAGTPLQAGTACDDGNAQTTSDVCDGKGTCAGSYDIAALCGLMATLNGTCATVAYDPAAKACTVTPKNEGGSCVPDQCATSGTCSNGVCAAADTSKCGARIDDDPANQTVRFGISAANLAGVRAAVAWQAAANAGDQQRVRLVRPDGVREGAEISTSSKATEQLGTRIVSLTDDPAAPNQAALAQVWTDTVGVSAPHYLTLRFLDGWGGITKTSADQSMGSAGGENTGPSVMFGLGAWKATSGSLAGVASCWAWAGLLPSMSAFSGSYMSASSQGLFVPKAPDGLPAQLFLEPDGTMYARDYNNGHLSFAKPSSLQTNVQWAPVTAAAGALKSEDIVNNAVVDGNRVLVLYHKYGVPGSYLLVYEHTGTYTVKQLVPETQVEATDIHYTDYYPERYGAIFSDGGFMTTACNNSKLMARFYDPSGKPYGGMRTLPTYGGCWHTATRVGSDAVLVAWNHQADGHRYAIAYDRYGRALYRPEIGVANSNFAAVAATPSGAIHAVGMATFTGTVALLGVNSAESSGLTALWSSDYSVWMRQPTLAIGGGGHELLVWTQNTGGGPRAAARMQPPAGNAVTVALSGTWNHDNVGGAVLPDGQFAITTDSVPGYAASQISCFDAAGKQTGSTQDVLGGSFTGRGALTVVAAPDKAGGTWRYITAMHGNGGQASSVYLSAYDSNCTLLKGPVAISAYSVGQQMVYPTLAANSAGLAAVVWAAAKGLSGAIPGTVWAQSFDVATLAASGSAFQVAPSMPMDNVAEQPVRRSAALIDGAGVLAFAWSTPTAAGNEIAVARWKLPYTGGLAVAPTAIVNVAPAYTGTYTSPSLAVRPDGTLVVAYTRSDGPAVLRQLRP